MCPSDNNNLVAPPLASLPGLPEELCLAVIEQCDIPSMLSLLQTSRRFHRLTDPHSSSRRPQMEAFLIEAQSFPRYREQDGSLACFACNRILPHSAFADKHTRTPRSRLGSQQRKRFCIACGVDKGLFTPGTLVKQGSSLRLVYRGCKQFKQAGFCRGCMFCTACIRGRPKDFGHCRWSAAHDLIHEGLEHPRVEGLSPAATQAVTRLTISHCDYHYHQIC
jgi:hypothetical protein